MRVRTGTTITSKVGIPIAVEIQCEACDHVFKYPVKVEAAGSHSYATPLGIGVEAGRANAESKAQERAKSNLVSNLERIQKGDTKLIKEEFPCPQCGYFQSWMAKRHTTSRSNVIAIGILFLASLVVTILAALEPPNGLFCAPVTLVLAVILVWFIIKYARNVNKQWFIDRGKNPKTDTPPARAPINVYLIEPSKR